MILNLQLPFLLKWKVVNEKLKELKFLISIQDKALQRKCNNNENIEATFNRSSV